MATPEPVMKEKEKKSRGSNSFASGKKYQTNTCNFLNSVQIDGVKCEAIEVEGAKAGPDIRLISHSDIGLETKKNKAFEGGCKKVYWNGEKQKLEIMEDSVHKTILGDHVIYDGLNLPWYEGKKSLEDWTRVKQVFSQDIYLPANNTAISDYYQKSGVSYIQIENTGLYHTGVDPLQFGVPYFSCAIQLRIRSTKHMKNGISTDITAALQYNKKQIVKSPYSLDGILPPSMKKLAAE